MFEGTVLGIDPGTAAVGLAAVGSVQGRLRVAWSETVRTPPGLPAGDRLRRVYGAVREAISNHAPAGVAVERLMWGRNTGSAMEVSRASGVILLAAADAVAVAVCHLQQSRLRGLVRVAR
jgi:crossover junction endodeoxyribonuclease RuvC